MSWSVEASTNLYGVQYWGGGYFGINDKGNVEVTPHGSTGPKLDLMQLVEDLDERGIRMPMLIRFNDIVRARIELLNACFAKASKESGYRGKYRGVYPIKVNQQKHLLDEIVKQGRELNLGLECGSKPELLIALAMVQNNSSLIVCNGFKDRAYIETALLARKLGREIIIVIDRPEEVGIVIEAAQKLQVKPQIGFRAKLHSSGDGKWMDSAGAKSKFGLTPPEMLRGIELLKSAQMEESLVLVHFHIGSQIPSIQSIKSSMKEGARFYTELCAMGLNIRYVDVGGGLGVNYDGSGHSDSSTNYSEQEYANDVVSIIQSICEEKNCPHPDIITESGRAIVAHSTVLIFNILGLNEVAKYAPDFKVTEKDSRLIQDLKDIYETVTPQNLNEFYNDLVEKKRDTLNLFTYGVLSLEQRAKAEELYWAIATKMLQIVRSQEDTDEIRWKLEEELTDTYFGNFSVFQSLPDAWAVDQLFPVMPIHRHKEMPSRRAKLVDLTCDSDGKIDRFIDIDTGQTQNYLEVHPLNGKKYYLGVFLTGAYQEILGDLHNLFGDTDAVHVSVTPTGYHVSERIKGDNVAAVLKYVAYDAERLVEIIRRLTESGISEGLITQRDSRWLLENYEKGLGSYTYLVEDN